MCLLKIFTNNNINFKHKEMRYIKFNLVVWASASMMLLASCAKEIVAGVTIPEELEQTQSGGTGLESYSYTVPFEVVSDSDWKIELDEAGEEIAYVYPSSGKGNAEV